MQDKKIERKIERLESVIRDLAGECRVFIAFSGGVDSGLLAKISLDVLGDRVTAVTVASEFVSPRDVEDAGRIARETGIRHLVVETAFLEDPDLSVGYPLRCYYCKKRMISLLKEVAGGGERAVFFDGSNAEDLKEGREGRPGIRALREAGVSSPLALAGYTKEDVRSVSRELGLPACEKPSNTCLATRIPVGEKITLERLLRIDEAENYIRQLGVGWLRVRDHGDIARIEVLPEDREKIFSNREALAEKLGLLGYKYITLNV